MSRRSLLRTLLQVIAFLAGVAALVWAVRKALSPDNQQMLSRLRDADASHLVLLGALSLGTVLINGLLFQISLRPVRRLRVPDVLSVNAISTLLALAPFKVSLIFRVLFHNRRDKVPVLTIGAWMGAFAAVMGAVLTPMLAVGAWRGRADALWFALVVGGILLIAGSMLAVARLLSHETSWARFTLLVHRLPMPRAIARLLEKPDGVLARVHEGVRMLASPRSVVLGVLLRIFDTLIHAARFYIAAKVLNFPLSPEQALLAGSVFFLIGAVAPAGQVGVREGGTPALLKLVLPGIDLKAFVVVVMLVSVIEIMVVLLCAGVGIAYLRPDRLFKLRKAPASSPVPDHPPEPRPEPAPGA